MAAQSSVREELNVLRRREWERRNQEVQQEQELYQEATPLFGEPYKTNKGDELSRIVQRMLGNYEDGNSSQYGQYDEVIKGHTPTSAHGRSGCPAHKDKVDSSFQNSSGSGTGQTVHPVQGSVQPSQKNLVPDSHGKDNQSEADQRKMDTWPDTRDYVALLPVLPDLSPPAEPLSPLHSSESSDSERNSDGENHGSRSPKFTSRTEVALHTEAQKEVQPVGEAPPLASQTFPPPLSSKPTLANSKKPMALVRPMDGPDQVTSESPHLKPPSEDFHGQPYESLLDLKNSSKQSLLPLKIPSVETLPNELQRVEEILREMTHSWPPLLTAIRTPSTSESAKFSFPSKEVSHVHQGYQQPQKHHESPEAPPSPCRPDPVVPEEGGKAVLGPPGERESGTSSDSESSSGSESDSESSESGPEENPPAPTQPVKPEGVKDINWQLITWINQSQQNLNPQNHSETVPDPKTANPPPPEHLQDDPKPRTKRHHSTHTPPAPAPHSVVVKSASSHHTNQHGHKATSQPPEISLRKTVGNKEPAKSSKVPRPEGTQVGLKIESVEVTPCTKVSTFKIKSKSGHKPDAKKTKRHSDRKEKTDAPPKVSAEKEADPASPPCFAPLPSVSPTPRRSKAKSSSRNETGTPVKSSRKSRARSSTREKKSLPSAAPDPPQSLLVKIELSQLSRVPQAARAANQGASQETEHGSASKVAKKRPAEKSESSAPRKKAKLEKESRKASSQHHVKTQEPKSLGEEKESSKKVPPPHAPQEQHPEGSGHKRRSGEVEESSSSGKHRRKSSGRQEQNRSDQKSLKSSAGSTEAPASCSAPATHRPLLKFEDRQFSVDHHMKEAKKLKHKADATVDKVGKAFNYLDAAMSFIESGIAMETDPQTPKSAYTMFSETVDLIRFILKLKTYPHPSAPASEQDFLVLCMRCQALLQMAMFRCKRDSALKYSRTLTDHFKNSKSVQAPSPHVSKSTGTPSPMSPTPSPSSSVSSGPASNPGSSTVAIPQVIQQVASSYVNITTLFLSAHNTWEQAEELARKSSGMLKELDAALGPLSLTSGMTCVVRYTRQGLHWLRLDASSAR